MTEHDILDAIGDIDPAYLVEAKRKPLMSKVKWVGVASLAACFLLLFTVPICYQHFWLKTTDIDYAPKESRECSVYFLQDGDLYDESVEVFGGDAELFEVWAMKNRMTETVDLQDISFEVSQREADIFDVLVRIPILLSHYFEGEDGVLRLEALKRTIASYREIQIGVLSIEYL